MKTTIAVIVTIATLSACQPKTKETSHESWLSATEEERALYIKELKATQERDKIFINPLRPSPVNDYVSCGSTNGDTFSEKPTLNLCSDGIPSEVSGTGPWAWSCTGSSGLQVHYCSADIIATEN